MPGMAAVSIGGHSDLGTHDLKALRHLLRDVKGIG